MLASLSVPRTVLEEMSFLSFLYPPQKGPSVNCTHLSCGPMTPGQTVPVTRRALPSGLCNQNSHAKGETGKKQT